nr:cytochrome P450 [Pharsalia antennata]
MQLNIHISEVRIYSLCTAETMTTLLLDYFSSILISFVILIVVATTYVNYTYGYWRRKKIPYLEPTFPFGNSDSLVPTGVAISGISKKFYGQFKSMRQNIGGVFIGIRPHLVVMDPDLIRDILIKNFQHFTDRGLYHTEKDPLSVNLLSQTGLAWKNARVKFTSLFSSAKLKSMFGTMLECSEGLKGALEKLAEERSDVDMLEVAACYATDVIGSCAFGIDCNSFKHPNADFRRMGRKFFTEFSVIDRFNLFLTIYAPRMSRKIGVRNIQKEVSSFFMKTITDTVNYREKNDLRRNDLLQVMIDMKNSEEQLSMNELVAQVFNFFLAGFETSSATANLTLFEISRNPEWQEKLREEILEVLKKYGNEITYDAIAEMKYLGQAVEETLRIWPPLQTLTRVCTKDYKFQNSDITINEGTPIMIPVTGLHHDPEYWPDPDLWDPDRFSEENKGNIRPFTYLPFGEGPRNCIALRFGLIQTKIALITVLSKYRVILSPKTITPLGIDPRSFVLITKNRVYLRLEKI